MKNGIVPACIFTAVICLAGCFVPVNYLQTDFSNKGKGKVLVSWNPTAGDPYINGQKISPAPLEYHAIVDVGDNTPFTLRFEPRLGAEFLRYSVNRATRDYQVYSQILSARADDAVLSINIHTTDPVLLPADRGLPPFIGIRRVKGSDLFFLQTDWYRSGYGSKGGLYDPSTGTWYRMEKEPDLFRDGKFIGISLEEGILSADVLGDSLKDWNLLSNPLGSLTSSPALGEQSLALVSFPPRNSGSSILRFQEWHWGSSTASSRLLTRSGSGPAPNPDYWWEANLVEWLDADHLLMVSDYLSRLWILDLELGRYIQVNTGVMNLRQGGLMPFPGGGKVLVPFYEGWYWVDAAGRLTREDLLSVQDDAVLVSETDRWLILSNGQVKKWVVGTEDVGLLVTINSDTDLVLSRSGTEFFTFDRINQEFSRGSVSDANLTRIILPVWDGTEVLE